ncbi:MAG: tRNA (adenosine(37)-N6)-threonylcarbamoyltransferase complex dimerization subunit type 1 TsaB [Eubacteriales bacterium]|nr:tRNA (adenosine(37)-N6)-threonylcarbamoyltransferase complex dimerization subunit type 1 TsaB [Eubacteriales bacterium]
MKILAFDTSTIVATVAVCEDTKLLGEYVLNHEKKHSEKIMPMTEHLLKDLGLSPAEFDLYAASIGPGSFTGLRIGVSTVKAMAYAAKKPAAGIPTLDVLAFNAIGFNELICPMIDARNNQVYTALYKKEKGSVINITEYVGVDINIVIEKVKEIGKRVMFVGEGAVLHSKLLLSELGESAEIMPENLNVPRASSVAHFAYLKAETGQLQDSFDLVPFYLRKSQAERELEKRGSVIENAGE